MATIFIGSDVSKKYAQKNQYIPTGVSLREWISADERLVATKYDDNKEAFGRVLEMLKVSEPHDHILEEIINMMGLHGFKTWVESLMRYLSSNVQINADQTKPFIEKVNNLRENNYQSTISNILNDNYRLVGMGNWHRRNIKPFLLQHRDKIDHFFIDEWLKDTKARNERRADKSIIREEDKPFYELALRDDGLKRRRFGEEFILEELIHVNAPSLLEYTRGVYSTENQTQEDTALFEEPQQDTALPADEILEEPVPATNQDLSDVWTPFSADADEIPNTPGNRMDQERQRLGVSKIWRWLRRRIRK